jgi:hypothetical protein
LLYLIVSPEEGVEEEVIVIGVCANVLEKTHKIITLKPIMKFFIFIIIF